MSKKNHKQHPPLDILRQKLEDQGFQASYIAGGAEEDLGFDSLLIILDDEEHSAEDSKEGQEIAYALQAFFVEDMMRAEDPEMPDDETPDFATLQFMMELPVDWSELSPERQLEGYRLLSACSQKMPLGYFSCDEGELFFTCSILAEDQRVPSKVLVSAVDMMSFFLVRMSPVFESFADDKLSLEQALEMLDQRILEADA
ncbi:MAG: hypothetical protein ACO1RX_15420 [Candidatus Sericytochromatia bacterium]